MAADNKIHTISKAQTEGIFIWIKSFLCRQMRQFPICTSGFRWNSISSEVAFLTTAAYKAIFQTPLSFYYLRNWHLTSIELTTSNLVCYVTIWPFICECLFPHLDHKCLKDRNHIACRNSQLKVMHTTRVWWMNGDFPEKETRATTNPFLCRLSFLIMYQTKDDY